MPKRGENIHKRKDGRWEGRYKKGVNDCGKTMYGSVYGKTYGEAKAKLLSVLKDGSMDNRGPSKEYRFQEVLFLWMANNRIRHKGATEVKYQYLIDSHIAPKLGQVKMSKLTAFAINSFLHEKLQSGRLDKRGGLSPSYVRSMMLIINSALQFAVNERMCQPLHSAICKPMPEKKKLQILNVLEQKCLETYLSCEPDFTKLGVFISLHTGMRIGEVCALTWENIDFTEKIIHVRATVTRVKNADGASGTRLIIDKPKTKSSIRDIPITSTLLSQLLTMKQHSFSRYVISEKDSFVSPRTYEYRYHKLLKQCGVSRVHYHALRHTFATRCIEVGVDVKTLSEILGHANVSITLNTYVHSSMDLKRKQIEKLVALAN